MKTGTVELGNASLYLSYSQVVKPNQRGFAREITEFGVPEEHRGKGEGTKLLEAVCEQADDEKILLLLIADNVRLATFYARHGFKVIQETPMLMARSPLA